MANPIAFRPVTADFKLDLQRRLATAPDNHASAILAAYDVLQAAHEHGLLDILQGMFFSRDTIINTLAKYANTPEGVTGIRNLLTAATILTEVDPEVLTQLSQVMASARNEHQQERKPPSLWQLAKRATSEDSRRGLSFIILFLSSFGKSLASISKQPKAT